MSKRLTITLTDEEYGDLERLALQERRSEREMAAYLVVKHSKPAMPGTLTLTPNRTYTSTAVPTFGLVN